MIKKALAIDGNSLFYRMYYATIKLAEFAINNNSIPNNAIKLLLNTILKYLNNNEYDYFFIAFDSKEKTFRHELLSSYKENRTKAPDDLYSQMVDAIECLKLLGVYVAQKPGIEADDLVGSFSKFMGNNNIVVDVISSDKDLLQLVDNNCNLKLIKKGVSEFDEYNINNFSEKFHGLLPKQIVDYKSIIGDKSDCLPGVKGIGEKIGIKLLLEFGSLENIYDNIDNLSPTIKQKFIDSKELAYKCKKLAQIVTNEFDNYNDINVFLLKKIDTFGLDKYIKKYNLKDLEKYTFLTQESLFDKGD